MKGRLNNILHKHRVKMICLACGVLVLIFLGINFGNIWAAVHTRLLESRGNTAYEEGRFDDAEVFYRKALKGSAGLWRVQYNLGNTYYRQERYAEACEIYRQSLASPGDMLETEVWNNIGNASYKQGKLEASVQAYKKALILSNGNQKIRQDYLFVLNQLEREKMKRPGIKKNKAPEKNEPDDKAGSEDGDKKNTPPEGDQKYQLSANNLSELFKKIDRDEDAARGRISKAKRKIGKAPVADGPDY